MEDLLGIARRLGPSVTGLFVVAIAFAPSTTLASEPPPPETPQVPEPAEVLNTEEAVIAALHRKGEQRYAEDDYAGAREAWLDAYGRVPAGPGTHPYRVTLLSLIATATLADYAVTGAQEPLRQTEQLLAGALEQESDPALRAFLEQQLERVRPLLKAEPSSEPTPDLDLDLDPAPPAPMVLEPDPSPPADDSPPMLHPASTPLLIVGSVTVAGGLAMIGAGSAFGRRAEAQVPDDDDSQEGRDFIVDERGKGYAWIGAGAGTAVIGVALVVSGAVLRARSRRPGRQTTVLFPIRGGAALALSRRF